MVQNNQQADHKKEGEGLDDEFIPDDAQPVCRKCLNPCHPLQNYCGNCDSNEAINPLASYMPFVRLRFAYGMFGKMWRSVWYDEEASIIFRLFCLCLISLFAPILLIVGLPLLLIGRIPEPKLRKTTEVVFYIIAVVLFMVFIYFGFFRGTISAVVIR